jgi:hypothetical protein
LIAKNATMTAMSSPLSAIGRTFVRPDGLPPREEPRRITG